MQELGPPGGAESCTFTLSHLHAQTGAACVTRRQGTSSEAPSVMRTGPIKGSGRPRSCSTPRPTAPRPSLCAQCLTPRLTSRTHEQLS